MRIVVLLLALLFCFGCTDDSKDSTDNNNKVTDNKYCKDKAEGAECDNSEGWCICFKGKAYLNVGQMCHEPTDCIDEECLGLHTGDSCGEGKVCSCGEGQECTAERTVSCLKLQPYESEPNS